MAMTRSGAASTAGNTAPDQVEVSSLLASGHSVGIWAVPLPFSNVPLRNHRAADGEGSPQARENFGPQQWAWIDAV